MKYIRTKCGKIVKHPRPNAEVFTFRYEILKTADTIEELCDKWVVIENGVNHVLAYECDVLDKINNNKKAGIETTAYGAIWTDEGLIYVAKMNKKGCLELL